MNFELFALYLLAVTAMIATPGPVVVLVVGVGLSGGARGVFQTILGTNAASLVLIALSVCLLKGLIFLKAEVFELLKLVGAFYIAYSAWGLLRETHATEVPSLVISSPYRNFFKGFSLALSNPKDIVFFAAFFPQFVEVVPDPNKSIIVLTLVWIIIDFLTLSCMGLFIRKFLRPSFHRAASFLSGILLFLIAAVGIWMSGKTLLISMV